MIRSPVRRSDPSRRDDASLDTGTGDARPTADGRLAPDGAPIAKRGSRTRSPDGLDYETLVAATGASERRAIETASRTAAALGSVASWIERAQEQLTETSITAARAQSEAASVLADAVDSLAERLHHVERRVVEQPETRSFDTAIESIQRLETRLAARLDADMPTKSEFETAIRGFETRIGDLSARLSQGPRSPARRPLLAGQDLSEAVAEIRTHKAHLAAGLHGSAQPATLPSLGHLARSQTAILTTLRADVAQLAGRLDAAGTGSGHHSGTESLREELDSIRDSVSGVATRGDFDRLENVIRSLTVDIADLRRSGQKTPISTEMKDLQSEIRRLADIQLADHEPAARNLDRISDKLDMLSAGGVRPEMIGTLSRQVEDVRDLLTNAAAPQAMHLVNRHLEDLRRDIEAVGGRQIDISDFTSLKSTIGEMHAAITALGHSDRHDPAIARAVRDVGQPIEKMLAALVEKIEHVETRIPDADAMDHLERQIEALASRMATPAAPDRNFGGLERSMNALMSEITTWREGAQEAAEHAARTAVAEALGSLPSGNDMERHLSALKDHYAGSERRTHDVLAAVNTTLDDVGKRLAALEGDPQSRIAPKPPGRPAAMAAEPAVRPPAARPVVAPPGLDASRLPPTLPENEVLLEPGAGRPGPAPAASARDRAPPDTVDIKSSFIAAARRAAQTAAADQARPKRQGPAAATPARTFSGLKPSELARNLRRMIDERRRPLLLAAAALMLALGTVQVVRTGFDDFPLTSRAPSASLKINALPSSNPSRATPPAGPILAALGSAPMSGEDPTTTQSIDARSPVRSDGSAGTGPSPASPGSLATGQREPLPTPPEAAPSRMAAIGTASIPTPAAEPAPMPQAAPQIASRPASVDTAGTLPKGIKYAASLGDPVALYELAVRTTEGRGVTRDPKSAAGFFEKAAERGLAPAQYRIGNVYEKGIGVPRDVAAAKTWYKRAAEQGNIRAMHNYAVLLAEGGGAKSDYAGAIEWFTRAAEQGVRDSQFNLAVLHARGLGTPADLAKSYVWLALAAIQGDEDAGRKRDEVAGRLSTAALSEARSTVQRWRVTPTLTAANDVQVPAAGWPEPAPKKPAREAKA